MIPLYSKWSPVNLRNGDQTGTVDRSLKKETNFNKSHFGLRSNLICGIDISEGSFSILGSGSFQGLYRTPDFFNQCLFSISPRMINKFKFYCTNNRCILEISKSTVTGPFKGVLHVGLQIKPFFNWEKLTWWHCWRHLAWHPRIHSRSSSGWHGHRWTTKWILCVKYTKGLLKTLIKNWSFHIYVVYL